MQQMAASQKTLHGTVHIYACSAYPGIVYKQSV